MRVTRHQVGRRWRHDLPSAPSSGAARRHLARRVGGGCTSRRRGVVGLRPLRRGAGPKIPAMATPSAAATRSMRCMVRRLHSGYLQPESPGDVEGCERTRPLMLPGRPRSTRQPTPEVTDPRVVGSSPTGPTKHPGQRPYPALTAPAQRPRVTNLLLRSAASVLTRHHEQVLATAHRSRETGQHPTTVPRPRCTRSPGH